MPMIEEKLKDGGEVLFSPNGSSMLPALKPGRDTAVLVSPPQKLKKYDVALFMHQNGQYVLHRVICVGEAYTFIGDNLFECERNIEHGDVIALCIAFERDGKRHRFDSFSARAFARFWHGIRPMRKLYRKFKIKLKSVLKK